MTFDDGPVDSDFEDGAKVVSVGFFSLGSACKTITCSVASLPSSIVRIVRRVISVLATITPTTLMNVMGWFL